MGFALSFAVETSIKVVKCCYGFEEGNEDLERAKKSYTFEPSAGFLTIVSRSVQYIGL